MAKGSNNLAERRSTSRNAKPYDANNSFVKKVANKVTDFIPQRSWISKWFNSSQDNGDMLNDNEGPEDVKHEEDVQNPPPLKRPRIRMDVTHPPGTFTIQPINKTGLTTDDSSKNNYCNRDDMTEDFTEPTAAGPSGAGRLISSTPALQTNIRNIALQRSDLNSLVSAQNNGATNGTDDNSESSESTSGCSSLIPQINRQEAPSNIGYNSPFTNRKRFVEDKLNFTNHLQSPRSLFLDSSSRDTLSNRRPSFNASMMTNTLDRASPLSSPFYSGNITFGGANAAGLFKRQSSLSSSLNETKLRVPKRTNVQVQVSEATEIDSSGMSQTAKKILEALEHFSSPISDAKKIPVKSTSSLGTPSMGKKRSREEMLQPSSRVGLRHLTRELTVPTVPDMLKLRRRQKLQDTTIAARQIVSAHSGPPPAPQEYRLRSENEDSTYRGKLRSKSKTNLEEEETVEAVNLPNIALPITSLPSFNFTLPQFTTTTDKNSASKNDFKFASPIKLTETVKDLKSINNFSFSKPISAKDKMSLNSSNESISKTSSSENDTTFTNSTPITAQNFIWSGASTAPRLKEKPQNKNSESCGFKTANELKIGSVMDVLSNKSGNGEGEPLSQNFTNETSKSSDSKAVNNNTDVKMDGSLADLQNDTPVWECRECLIRNSNGVTRCIACKESKSSCKVNKTSQPLSTLNSINTQPKPAVDDCFGSQFKAHSNNKESTENQDNTPTANNTSKPQVSSESLDKFKAAKDSWECPGCMLRNAANVITCPCCNASKPSPIKVSPKKKVDNSSNSSASTVTSISSNVNTTENQKVGAAMNSTSTSNTLQSSSASLLETFKPKADTWECPSCMVRNNDTVATCPCCNQPKPGGSGNNTSAKSAPAPIIGFGDKFKKPEGAWTCDSCMLQNDAKVSKCVACEALKPGSKTDTKASTDSSTTAGGKWGAAPCKSEFKFGIDKANITSQTDNISSANGFKFGENKPTTDAVQFTFGIPKPEQASTSEASKITGVSGSNANTRDAGAFQTTAQKSGDITAQKKEGEAETKTLPSFCFTATKSEDSAKSTGEQNANTVQQTTATSSAGFTFGLQKPTETKTETKSETQNTMFGNTLANTPQSNASSSAVSISTANTNASASTTQPATSNVTPLSTFAFGVSNTSVTSSATMSLPTASSFTFPKPQATTTQSTVTPAFGQVPTSTAPTFSFGANATAGATTEPTAKTTAAPSFGTSTSTSIFASTPSATPLFGANADKPAATFGATETKAPPFGMNDNKSQIAFGTGENKAGLFGTPDSKVSTFGAIDKATPPPPAFTAPTPAATPATATAPAFGSTAGTPSLFGTSATPAFGSNTAINFSTASTPSIFPTTKPAEASASSPGLFTFGANRPATQSTGGFNIQPSVTPQKDLFAFRPMSQIFGGNFNAPAAPAATTSNVNFPFNAAKPDAPGFGQPAASVPVFGATQPTPQAQSTSTFSSTPAPTAGFNFGTTVPAAPSGGFNFGASTAPTASTPSTGFNFNAPSASPAVAFDPNTRPTFNFTGGSAPPAFNAVPQPQVPRKFKKAVRRMR